MTDEHFQSSTSVPTPRSPRLEVIVASVADARAAEAGGADRLELVSRLDLDGLTPPLALVRAVLEAVRLPVRVMLRDAPTLTVADAAALSRLCATAHALATLPIDGLVLGFVRDGEVESEPLAAILAAAPGIPATFHRAFEMAADPVAALATLKRFPQIDRILTSGDGGLWPERAAALARLAALAAPEITILVGGGLDEAALRPLRRHTALTEFHIGRAARLPARTDGAVSAERVRTIRALLDEYRPATQSPTDHDAG